ncbi:hypothetical protein B0H21DRAFT_258517 [Amylocystis lapponica]|nr:hypothetical protein B0H21DRAFT_258517 [Amylocystis lapponica]
MTGRKRRMPTSDRASSTRAKRQHMETVVVDDGEDEESLESVLARIKAQEESEVLAQHLQAEWGSQGVAGASAASSSSGQTGAETEDDEAMARRLAAEWDALDANPEAPSASGLSTVASSSNVKGKAPEADTTLDEILRRHEDLFIGSRKCQCGNTVSSPRGHVTYSTQIPPPSLLALLHAPCKSCKINHCRGCFKVVDCPLTCKGKGKEKNGVCAVQSCCAEVRAIALFEALGGFDRQSLGERATADTRAREAAAQRSARLSTVGPGGTGYSMSNAMLFHAGYIPGAVPSAGGARGKGRTTANSSSHLAARLDELASHWDEVVARALATVTQFLPEPYADSPQMYDMLPHASIEAILSLSQLPEVLGNLLRNDSVTDWIARADVYYAMLALLRRLADCELTIPVLIGQRWGMQKSCGLEEWMWGDGDIVWEKSSGPSEQLVKAPPLYAHFKKLTKQCEAFLTGASVMLEGQDDDGSEEIAETVMKGTSLCGDIIAARDGIERAMGILGKEVPSTSLEADEAPQTSSKKKGKGPDPAIALERTYVEACERLAFQHVTLSQPSPTGSGLDYPSFNFAPQLAQTVSATRKPKDRLHLIKELAVMATSLPPGVWVRVDEVRNDAIKVMIAGPEGTPYAGGLFEFDCFIPLEYPNKPPLMHLRTTGGGTVRFNPNLYNQGKVCLSLLGTWAGRPEEQWSRKSTLLQVLVSIQSMILVELPFFNEPGFGQADPKSAKSIAYNRNISVETTRWAIVDWLKDEHRDGIWADVIASHFTIRNTKIRKCIQEWAAEEPRIRKCTQATRRPASGLMFDDILNPAAPMDAMVGHVQALPSGRRGRGAEPSSSSPSRDLLAEYDRGIQTIQCWANERE